MNDYTVEATLECLNANLLESPTGATQHGNIVVGFNTVYLNLPPAMVCSQCVLQWKYRGGKSFRILININYILTGIVLPCRLQLVFYNSELKKIFFYPLKVVSRYRDPQLQVGKK